MTMKKAIDDIMQELKNKNSELHKEIDEELRAIIEELREEIERTKTNQRNRGDS